jgi:uncharacterized protein (TIGR03382 family)
MKHSAARRNVLLTSVVGLLFATSASGGQLIVDQIFFDDAGNALPSNMVTVRVYWQGPSDNDQLVGVVGSPSNPMHFEVSGGTFFDSDHFLAGDRPPEFGLLGLPGFEELSYDSWFTIGNTSLDVGPDWPSGESFSDQVFVHPGTSFDAGGQTKWVGGSGGPFNIAWTVPPTQEDPGGGGVVPSPQSVAGNWPNNQVAIMQFTLVPDPGSHVNFVGTMGLLTIVDGVATETQGNFKPPAPGTLAVLALAGLAGTRRRRG